MSSLSPELQADINPNLHAVLIGGGKPYATGIDLRQGNLLELGLEMTGCDKPNALIIPSARWKSQAAIERIVERLTEYYRSRGVGATALHPFLYEQHSFQEPALSDLTVGPGRMPSRGELENRIGEANVTFILGGDTHRMLKQVWRPNDIDTMLAQAIDRGAIMTGSSAGALAWFEGMMSDSSSRRREAGTDYDGFRYVDGLGYIRNTIGNAHHNTAPNDRPDAVRSRSFERLLADHEGKLGIGIDEHAALVLCGNGIARVRTDRLGSSGGGVHAIRAVNGQVTERMLEPDSGEFSLSDL